MTGVLFNSQRTFQIWEYTVGHGQLLLRSPKADDMPKRIDVLFKNVAAIHLLTTLNSLTISEANEEDQIDSQLQVGSQILMDRKVFLVRSSEFVGYVIAGTVAWHEDEGEYYDPSFFRLRPN
jgi:hypothetical protein